LPPFAAPPAEVRAMFLRAAPVPCAMRSFQMSKEMVISANPHETRVAIMEEGLLCEYYVEREKEFALSEAFTKGV
jgi:hypothetical protein